MALYSFWGAGLCHSVLLKCFFCLHPTIIILLIFLHVRTLRGILTLSIKVAQSDDIRAIPLHFPASSTFGMERTQSSGWRSNIYFVTVTRTLVVVGTLYFIRSSVQLIQHLRRKTSSDGNERLPRKYPACCTDHPESLLRYANTFCVAQRRFKRQSSPSSPVSNSKRRIR